MPSGHILEESIECVSVRHPVTGAPILSAAAHPTVSDLQEAASSTGDSIVSGSGGAAVANDAIEDSTESPALLVACRQHLMSYTRWHR